MYVSKEKNAKVGGTQGNGPYNGLVVGKVHDFETQFSAGSET